MRPRGRAAVPHQSASAGIDRKAIDAVIVSHFHGDHMNGLLRADNSLTFPNAEILVPAAEMKFWMDDGEMSRAPKGRMEGLFKNVRRVLQAEVMKRLRAYEEGKEVLPGITATRPGTTPTSSRRAQSRCSCRPTSPTCRSCSSAIQAGMPSTTRIR
jgi:metal-dependent hydrolase (beta-lactamase superfamily II)